MNSLAYGRTTAVAAFRSSGRGWRGLGARLAFAGTVATLVVAVVPVSTVAAAGSPGPSAQPHITYAGDWSEFHNGPARLGYNTQETTLSASNVSTLVKAWSGTLDDQVFASPVVANGLVYVGTVGGTLYAFAAGCGTGGAACQPVWQTQKGAATIAATATVVGGGVYVGRTDGSLSAYDAAGVRGCSGSAPVICAPLWTAVTAGITSAVAVVGGAAFVTSSDGLLYAFDAAGVIGCSGSPAVCTPLWTASADGGTLQWSSPAVADGVVYVGSYANGYLYAFDAAGGDSNCTGTAPARTCTALWKAATGVFIAGSPAVSNGVVYVGSTDGYLFAFDATGGPARCTGTAPARYCTPLWSAAAGGGVYSSPAVASSVVYIGSTGDDNLYAFDAAGGSTYCTGTAPSRTCSPIWLGTTAGPVYSSPAVANGVVYVGSQDDSLYAFGVGCQKGGLSCSPSWSYATGDMVKSSPAISDGVVYVGSYDHKLYAFDLPIQHLTLSPATATIAAGVSQTYTAEGIGASSADLGDATSATTFTISGGGSCTGAACTSTVPGSHTVTGTYYGATGTATLTVTPGSATHFVVFTTATWTAGGTHTVTVTAKDAYGNTARSYVGTIHFTSTDSQAVMPPNYTFVAADNGVHAFTGGLVLKSAGSRSVTATDTLHATITGTQSGIVVSPNVAAGLAVSTAATWTAGGAHTVTVTAKDAYGNTARSYVGTIHFTSTDSQAVMPPNYTFVAGDNGVHAFTGGLVLKSAGSRSVTATDTLHATITGTQSGIVVSPGAARTFRVHTANPYVHFVGHSVTITALDAYGNTVIGYTGTIHITSSDGAATLPADHTFLAGDNGVCVLTLTLRTVGSQTVTATDTLHASITGSQTVSVT